MSKRKLISIYLVLALVAGLGIWGTSAFFVSEEKVHNIITSAGIAINLLEETDSTDASGAPIPFENIENAMPGETYSKIPKVKNVDSGDAWIRMKLEKSVRLADGSTGELPEDAIQLDLDEENWLDGGDGYFYYKEILKPTETTEPLFTTVTLKKELENEFMNAKFSLDLTAEAVQVANNGSTILEANGWPEE